MTAKTPRHPAEDAVEFWAKEARRTADALDASRRETADLERHYRLAMGEIRGLQERVRLLTAERDAAWVELERERQGDD